MSPEDVKQSDPVARGRLEPLGAGASGAVHKALDLVDLRFVAIKAISVGAAPKRRQLVAELLALYGAFQGPDAEAAGGDARHVVSFYDAFAHAPTHCAWLMVEYLDGGSLQDLVDRGGTTDEALLARLAFQIARGLRYLHARGFVHRDVKPANMLLSRAGALKISDFGIARRLDGDARETMARTFVGTTNYMSPERIGGQAYDGGADVWGFGATGSPVKNHVMIFREKVMIFRWKSILCHEFSMNIVGALPFIAPEVCAEQLYDFPVDVWGLARPGPLASRGGIEFLSHLL